MSLEDYFALVLDGESAIRRQDILKPLRPDGFEVINYDPDMSVYDLQLLAGAGKITSCGMDKADTSISHSDDAYMVEYGFNLLLRHPELRQVAINAPLEVILQLMLFGKIGDDYVGLHWVKGGNRTIQFKQLWDGCPISFDIDGPLHFYDGKIEEWQNMSKSPYYSLDNYYTKAPTRVRSLLG